MPRAPASRPTATPARRALGQSLEVAADRRAACPRAGSPRARRRFPVERESPASTAVTRTSRPHDDIGAVEQAVRANRATPTCRNAGPRMLPRCGGDWSQALTTSRGRPAPRFRHRDFRRRPRSGIRTRSRLLSPRPAGVCENCPHEATRSPLSSAARWSAERGARRERRSCARAQFTRHATARTWCAAGADASSAARQAPVGARYAFDELLRPRPYRRAGMRDRRDHEEGREQARRC